MEHNKIFGPAHIESFDGNRRSIPIGVFGGGKRTRRIQYMVVIDQAADTTNCTIGLVLHHGPDGLNFKTHSTVISATSVGTPPTVLEGTVSDSTSMIGEYRRPFILIADSRAEQRAAQSATVTVYETLKPF